MTQEPNIPQVIYLNGASSSGKTTLAKAIQEHASVPFLLIGIDKMIGMMPEKINDWTGDTKPDGFGWEKSEDHTGNTIYQVHVGPFGRKISNTLKNVVLALLNSGHHVIIDDVALRGKEEVDEWKEALKPYSTLFVGIKVPLEVLEKREHERQDRIIGSARAQFYKVHQNVQYDLEIDTSKTALDECAKSILNV